MTTPEILPDSRPIETRVRVIANRFAAIAMGYERTGRSVHQNAVNARRDAAWLNEAAEAIEDLRADLDERDLRDGTR